MNVEVPTLAEILGSGGFHTAAFVGNATYVTPVLGFARGFREFSDHNLEVADRVRSAFNLWFSGRRGRLFVFMNILDPHEPYMPPKPYDTHFPGYVGRYGCT